MQPRGTNDLRGSTSQGADFSGALPLQRLPLEIGFVLPTQHAERLVHTASIPRMWQRLRDEAYADLTPG